MLPRETSVRQLKKLRAETKGTDIGDLTTKDRLNMPVPNMQAIGNPVDTGIESWEDFSNKDSQLQTIAFKSKLVNKPLVKENKKETKNMKENIQKFEDFEWAQGEEQEELRNLNTKDDDDYDDDDNFINKFDFDHDFTEDELDQLKHDLDLDDDDDDDDDDDEDDDDDDEVYPEDKCHTEEDYYENESIKTFEAFSVPATKKEEKQPEYTILGKEKEPKSNPNFGIGAVKSEEIKTIGSFTDFTKLIDPVTPKERTIGGNAGVFIDNDVVKGYVNRIDGKDVYVESLDEPMVIKKFSLKDAVK